MKNRTINYFLISTTLFLAYSCGIVSLDESNPEIENTESISISNSFPLDKSSLNTALTNQTSKAWNVTGFTLGGSSSFQECRLDDTLTLNANGTYDYNGGNLLCGAEDNEKNKSGSWEVDFESRTLYFDRGTDKQIETFIEACEGSKVVVSTQYFGMEVLGRFEI